MSRLLGWLWAPIADRIVVLLTEALEQALPDEENR